MPKYAGIYWYDPINGITEYSSNPRGSYARREGLFNTCRRNDWPLIESYGLSNGHRNILCEYDILDKFGLQHRGLTDERLNEARTAVNVVFHGTRCKTCQASFSNRRIHAIVPAEHAIDLMGLFGHLAEMSRSLPKALKEIGMDREFVKLYKDGNVMGVETNAADSDAFMRLLAEAVATVVEVGKYDGDWQYQFEQWLPQAFNINAKLNGYKSDVQEIRVLRAGHSGFDADDQIYATPNVPSIVKDINAVGSAQDVVAMNGAD